MADAARAARLADRIKVIVAKALERRVKDPRLGFVTPTLTFVADEVPENAFHIESLLRETRERDAKLAAAAEGAQYAGDADPYKKDEAEADEDA